jgi:hypothetical protein
MPFLLRANSRRRAGRVDGVCRGRDYPRIFTGFAQKTITDVALPASSARILKGFAAHKHARLASMMRPRGLTSGTASSLCPYRCNEEPSAQAKIPSRSSV